MTPSTTLSINGIDVYVDGVGESVVLMMHGWPDTFRLWDATVAALQDQHRCVRFTLPGFDTASDGNPTSVADLCKLVDAIVQAVSPGQPVTLLMHDWGCIFGYEFAQRFPARVKQVVAVDIGDHNSGAYLKSLSTNAKLQVVFYQLWLALSWQLGHWGATNVANGMTRWMARSLRCPTDVGRIGWQMNYPYVMQWFGLAGGFRGAAQVKPNVPLLYCYGERKPFMFHSAKWLALQAGRADCAVQGFPCGHWVMLNQTEAFNRRLRDWLTRSETTVYSHKPG